MEEEKDSGASGSLSLSETESPPPVSLPFVPAPPIVDTAVINTGMSTGVASLVSSGGGGDLSGKKKRGRPRKYDADGNLRVPNVSPSLSGFTLTSPKSEFSSKRGRPVGSGNWQVLASLGGLFTSSAGGDFTPHVITVYSGEDIASKIISFSQNSSRGICVLSANGAVSNVTIRQPGSSGGILTYEGRFEILSLTGSFTVSDKDGLRSRTGGLSVSLAGPDGRVIGGSVAGLLMAANPIQIVVGSFMANGFSKSLIKKKHQNEPRAAAAVTMAPVTPATPISQSIPAGNFVVQNHIDSAADNDSPNGVHNLNCGWNGNNNSTLSGKTSPDINLSAPFEMN